MRKNKNKVETVLHICNYAAPYRGNFIDSLSSLEKYQGVKNVYLFPVQAHTSGALSWIEELNKEEICAYIQEKSILKNISLLKKIIKKHSVDRIVMHFTDFKTDAVVKLCFKSKKVARFFHNTYKPNNKREIIFGKLLWGKNLFIGVSDFVAKGVKVAFPKHRVCSVLNAISYDRLNVKAPDERNEKIVLTMMGWDWIGKGVDLALNAVEKINGKYDILLQIVAAKNSAEVEQFVVETLGKKVDWVKVLPPTNSVASYYKASDIFLSPSRAEAFCYAAVESTYCGNSLVASKVGGQGELQIEGAYWFETENVDDFANKIEQAICELNDPEHIAKKEKAKEDIQKIYSLERWSKELLESLESIN